MLHQREFDHVISRLAKWNGRGTFWLNIDAAEGAGKRRFARNMASQIENARLIFEFDFAISAFDKHFTIAGLFKYLVQRFPNEFTAYQNRQSLPLIKMISNVLERPSDAAWMENLLADFLRDLGKENASICILHGLRSAQSKEARSLIRILQESKNLPVLIITTATSSNDALHAELSTDTFSLNKLSVKETEMLLVDELEMNNITARLITNFVHIKSDGNERKIRCMVEAFYHSLYTKDPVSLVTSGELQNIQASSSLEDIFQSLFQHAGNGITELVAFLSRMEDPFPEEEFDLLAEHLNIDALEIDKLFHNELIVREAFFDQRFVNIRWQKLRQFLRHQTAISELRKPLEYFGPEAASRAMALPYQVSDQLFDVGKSSESLAYALREARRFRETGQTNRALERYGFLRRNLFRDPDSDIDMRDILRESGELQRQLGLFENAFESFRELREKLHRDFPTEWVYATLNMADVLIEMDGYSEARYLLQDIKIKAFTQPEAQALASLLSGKVERYSGNSAYAIRHYEKAASHMPKIGDEALSYRIYETLLRCYSEENREKDIVALTEKARSVFHSDKKYYVLSRLEEVRRLLHKNKYAEALPEVILLYRNHRTSDSSTRLQLKLYLAEIYAYLGKWYLSRSHLLDLLQTPLLLTSRQITLSLLFKVGIVEKELAHYGNALQYLSDAASLAAELEQHSEKYLIHSHLGHIHMLVRSFVRAGELLNGAHAWAKEHSEEELLLQTSLFLASYEMQHARLDQAKSYLFNAKAYVNLLDHSLDKLNYIFYLVCYHLEANDLEKAGDVVGFWEEQCAGIAKFENLALWLTGRVAMKKGNLEKAEPKLNEAFERSHNFRLPHFEFLVVRDLAALAKEQGNATLLEQRIAQAHEAFEKLLNAVGDDILRQQLEESREYDMLLGLSL